MRFYRQEFYGVFEELSGKLADRRDEQRREKNLSAKNFGSFAKVSKVFADRCRHD